MDEKKEGYGELHDKDGFNFLGFFHKDCKDGLGKLVDPDKKTEYLGSFKNDKKEGLGEARCRDCTYLQNLLRKRRKGK